MRTSGWPAGVFQVVDGGVDEVEVVLVQVGEQHHVADAAVAAVGGAAPGGLGLDGDHGEAVG
jgi:hypothetical protein